MPDPSPHLAGSFVPYQYPARAFDSSAGPARPTGMTTLLPATAAASTTTLLDPATLIAKFVKAWDKQAGDAAEAFTQGSCHDFALSLAEVLYEHGHYPTVLVGTLVAPTRQGTLNLDESCYNHTVVAVAGKTFDINGPRALERWDEFAKTESCQHLQWLGSKLVKQLPEIDYSGRAHTPKKAGMLWVSVPATEKAILSVAHHTEPEIFIAPEMHRNVKKILDALAAGKVPGKISFGVADAEKAKLAGIETHGGSQGFVAFKDKAAPDERSQKELTSLLRKATAANVLHLSVSQHDERYCVASISLLNKGNKQAPDWHVVQEHGNGCLDGLYDAAKTLSAKSRGR